MDIKFNLIDYDVVFLSYDEPNADQNYQQLQKIVPYAKRVHGIKGSDSAHKECARIAETERLIIVDGDNYVTGNFTNQILSLDSSIDDTKVVFSWPSKNTINGLLYGNGGIKCWNRQAILDIKTHENALPGDIENQVDFCWSMNYIPIDKSYSQIHNTGSKLQAWRAGFREGVKMSVERGYKVDYLSDINKGNFNRLMTWMTVGLDVQHGIWAILGARQGCYMTALTDWDFTQVRDFDYLNEFYKINVESLTPDLAYDKILDLGLKIGRQVNCPKPFDSEQSKLFKQFEINPDRQPKTVQSSIFEYDIVMITYNEPNMEENWKNLQTRFPRAKRVHGVKGIHNAHKVAANLVSTPMFYVVDGDAEIVPEFKFDFVVPELQDDAVRVWRCKNPVNDLVYGYGGVKLLPTELTKRMDMSKPDMTTSISKKFIPVQQLSNYTRFNTDEFTTWRSAFRECCKLASKVIDRQKDDETNKRLDVWCAVGNDRPYGEYAIKGAIAGRMYGYENKDNIEALKKINDFEWLRKMFDEQ